MPAEFEPRLVEERGRLERVARCRAPQHPFGDLPQLAMEPEEVLGALCGIGFGHRPGVLR